MEVIIRIKRKKKNPFLQGWIWKMAWHDARKNWPRLLLFTSSVVIGIAALVAIGSFNSLLQEEINSQARELLGADLTVNASKPFEEEVLALFDSAGVPQAQEANMTSMVLFAKTGQTRLVRVVAISGDFPFYGLLQTLPDGAFPKLQEGPFVLLDDNLAQQFEVSSGDSVRIGNARLDVLGVVTRIPGGGGFESTLAPSVYISMAQLDTTGLVQYGSRVNYRQFFKTEDEAAATQLLESMRPTLRKYGHAFETVKIRKESLGKGFENLYRFFNLMAFIALILGCIGVASSVHIYMKEKQSTVAVLRCLGADGWQAFTLFFIQTVFLGALGSLVGIGLGIGLESVFPVILEDLLPIDVHMGVSWKDVGFGFGVGMLITLLFSVLPLISVRQVPPLWVLRTDYQPIFRFSKLRLGVQTVILAFPLAFASWQTGSLLTGALFCLGLLVAFGVLFGIGRLTIFLVRKLIPKRGAFVWKQGVSNLFRPNNQTVVLVVVIGLGAFLIATLQLVRGSLLQQVEFIGRESQSNTVLLDIQPYQKEGVLQLVADNGLPMNQLVPIVTCRLAAIKGRPVAQWQKDSLREIPNWALTREYRVTYRDSLKESEKLVRGKFLSHVEAPGDTVWVTISQGMHENLGVDLGDSLVFDVQGVEIKAFIGGVREVEWQKDPPNFIFVFPAGVLEEAPQIYVLSTRIEDNSQSIRFQQQLVAGFPNVSMVDLRLVLRMLDELFDKVSFIIRFMALFSILTGLVVLAGAVINSRYLRLRERLLLKTLGARRAQIVRITLVEYTMLGVIAVCNGLFLSLAAGWILSVIFFKVGFMPHFADLGMLALGMVALVVLVGWAIGRDGLSSPPSDILKGQG
jgi:putative ABC transport system permease protein